MTVYETSDVATYTTRLYVACHACRRAGSVRVNREEWVMCDDPWEYAQSRIRQAGSFLMAFGCPHLTGSSLKRIAKGEAE